MGLALIFFLVSLLIGGITYSIACAMEPSERPFKGAIIAFIITATFLGTVLTAIITGNSYSSYLENRAFYDATVEQYRGAVEMYKDYALIDMQKTHEYVFTDLKYQGYQKYMAEKINELKVRIVSYNRSFILKRVKNASWFFDWYIIANDPDMKIIRMIEKRPEEESSHQVLIPDR